MKIKISQHKEHCDSKLILNLTYGVGIIATFINTLPGIFDAYNLIFVNKVR